MNVTVYSSKLEEINVTKMTQKRIFFFSCIHPFFYHLDRRYWKHAYHRNSFRNECFFIGAVYSLLAAIHFVTDRTSSKQKLIVFIWRTSMTPFINVITASRESSHSSSNFLVMALKTHQLHQIHLARAHQQNTYFKHPGHPDRHDPLSQRWGHF